LNVQRRVSPVQTTVYCLLLVVCAVGRADLLSSPPSAWADKVQTVAEMDLGGADPALAQAILQAREQLARMLGAPDTDAAALGDAYGRLGALYHLAGVTGSAERCYRNAVVLSPDNFRWPYYAGGLLLDNGRVEQALDRFERAGGIDPAYPPLSYRQAEAAYRLNRLGEAEGRFLALADDPDFSAASHYHLGQIALLRREYARAIDHLERALALAPDADAIHYPLANALRGAGEAERARAHLARRGDRRPSIRDPLMDELVALNRGARPHFVRAMAAVRQRDYAGATDHFAAGLALAADNADARVSFARALYLSGEQGRAREQLQRVTRQRPGHALAAFLLGQLHEENEEYDLARACYRNALSSEPEHAGAHFYLGGIAFRAKDFTAAAEHYGAAFAANPDIAPAPLMRVIAAARAGTADRRTAEELQALRDDRPDDPQRVYALARLRLLSADAGVRDAAAALAAARELARQMPAPPHLALLALAHAANGDDTAAQRALGQLDMIPPWLNDVDMEALRAAIATGSGPEVAAWADADPVLRPPPLQVRATMMAYPAVLPY